MVFGVPYDVCYFCTLIGVAVIMLICVLFLNGTEFITIGSFLILTSGLGYSLEMNTDYRSSLILLFSIIFGFICTSILHLYLIIPIKKAENSTTYTEKSLIGNKGRVITSIPKEGYGEIYISNKFGGITKTAKSFNQEEILADTFVEVTEIEDRVAYVIPCKESK